mmetsp:Transcript_2142/g.6363  ORF Transcript_2142/g.6363 Transcript_2142/m.6363 type:complete len:441 (+) Transcript_2142:1402-2724(+)
MALTRGLVFAFLGLNLILQNLELDIGLLGLLPLLLQLRQLLLGLALQLFDLCLEVLDALLPAGLEGLYVLCELLRQSLKPLLLLWHGMDVRLGLLQLGPHLLQRLLGSMVLAAIDALIDQRELMLLALDLTIDRRVLSGGGLHLLQQRRGLLVLLVLSVHAALEFRELLQTHQDVATPGGRAARDGAGGVIQIAIFGDRAHAHVGVESHLLCRFRRIAHQIPAENVFHRALDVLVEADDLVGQLQLATRGHDVPGLPDNVGWDGRVDNFVERDDRHTAPKLPALEQRLARVFVVNHHEEQAAAGADLQRPVVSGEFWFDVEQLGNDAFDFGPIEPSVRVGILEVHAAHMGAHLVEPLLQLVQCGFALARCGEELVVLVGVEIQVAQSSALFVEEIACHGSFLRQALALLLAVRQHLLVLRDALLETADGHVPFLQVGIHL